MALLLTAAVFGSSLAACGGSKWPASVRGVGDPRFMASQADVSTIDLLPIDLQVWTTPNRGDVDRVANQVEGSVDGSVTVELARRGYDVAAHIDRSGRFVGSDGRGEVAMPPDDLAALEESLAGYGRAQSQSPGGLLFPFLPARLGEATGSDATLYVGGWAFAGSKGSNKAVKVIGVILLVALVAVIVVAIAGKKGGGVGRVASGAGRAAAATGRVVTGAARIAGRAALGAARTAGEVAVAIARDPLLTRLTLDAMIEFASAGTHAAIYRGRPDYYAEGPRTGRSAVFLEMTLIDNRTGRALWHASQRFPASPDRHGQIERAVAHLMATLPAR